MTVSWMRMQGKDAEQTGGWVSLYTSRLKAIVGQDVQARAGLA